MVFLYSFFFNLRIFCNSLRVFNKINVLIGLFSVFYYCLVLVRFKFVINVNIFINN